MIPWRALQSHVTIDILVVAANSCEAVLLSIVPAFLPGAALRGVSGGL